MTFDLRTETFFSSLHPPNHARLQVISDYQMLWRTHRKKTRLKFGLELQPGTSGWSITFHSIFTLSGAFLKSQQKSLLPVTKVCLKKRLHWVRSRPRDVTLNWDWSAATLVSKQVTDNRRAFVCKPRRIQKETGEGTRTGTDRLHCFLRAASPLVKWAAWCLRGWGSGVWCPRGTASRAPSSQYLAWSYRRRSCSTSRPAENSRTFSQCLLKCCGSGSR